jgi:hypothetical protein
MRELERLEHRLADLGKPLPAEVTVSAFDLEAVCKMLRKKIEPAAEDAVQLKEDKKLVERVDKFGRDLKPNERDFISDMVERVAEGRPMTFDQRKWARDIDKRKVGG